MRHVWSDSWGARLEHLLYNGILLLQAIDKPNLVLLQRLYIDNDWRHRQLDAVTDPHILGYWRNEFDNLPANEKAIALSPVLNKVGRFTQDPFIRNIVAQSKPPFDLFRSMNDGRIVVVNLARGRIGETPSHLLGAFFATSLAQAAYKRDALPPADRTSFTVYADELQSYATESFTAILSEARKYNLHLVLAHQFIDQLPDGLSEAILGNVGTVIVARVSGDDAELLAKHLVIENPETLIELNNYEAPALGRSRPSDCSDR